MLTLFNIPYYYRITSLFSLDLSFHSPFYVVLSLGITDSLLFSIEFRLGSTKNEQSIENAKVIKCNLFERRAFKVSFLEISISFSKTLGDTEVSMRTYQSQKNAIFSLIIFYKIFVRIFWMVTLLHFKNDVNVNLFTSRQVVFLKKWMRELCQKLGNSFRRVSVA